MLLYQFFELIRLVTIRILYVKWLMRKERFVKFQEFERMLLVKVFGFCHEAMICIIGIVEHSLFD